MSSNQHSGPMHDDIAQLAYGRYLVRGAGEGSDGNRGVRAASGEDVSVRPRRRVLLVHNSVDEREMYAEHLRMRGYCTLQAATAHDGFWMAANLAPAVVVTDIILRGTENGLVLTSRLKQDATTLHAVVIVLSGAISAADRAAASKAGCDCFLSKPCSPEELETAMVEMVGRSG